MRALLHEVSTALDAVPSDAAWHDGAPTTPDALRALLAEHGHVALTRELPQHVTASAFVLDPTFTRALLVLHRKGSFWVQPGGHLEEGDVSPAAGAVREAAEETGAEVRLLQPTPVDLDAHSLHGGFGRCRLHHDLGYVVVADPDATTRISDESDDLAWWPLDALPAVLAGGVERRLAAAARAARGLVR